MWVAALLCQEPHRLGSFMCLFQLAVRVQKAHTRQERFLPDGGVYRGLDAAQRPSGTRVKGEGLWADVHGSTTQLRMQLMQGGLELWTRRTAPSRQRGDFGHIS